MGYSLWGHKESDTTEVTAYTSHLQDITMLNIYAPNIVNITASKHEAKN